MTNTVVWQPLLEALARWEHAGRVAEFWLRDDDAVEPTPALDQLLALANAQSVPATLAVIPAHTGDRLAARLKGENHVTVAVHGWSHDNHAQAGSKKQELGLHRPKQLVIDQLREGLSLLADLHGERFLPVLVPPWNRIDPDLIPELAELGYLALSTYGLPKPAELPVINSNVDLMDWHGTRGCRDHAALVCDIVAQLDRAFDGGDPVGLLTHHLVHDASAWDFLRALFAVTSESRVVRWKTIGSLVEETPAGR